MELSGEALKQALRRHLTYVFPFTHLNEHQMDVIRGIIDPRIIVRRTEDEFTALTRDRRISPEKTCKAIEILLGVTGSGKTVVLLARAKFLAEDGSKAVLVLCYNRLLSGYLQSQLASFSNIVVNTFDAWAGRKWRPQGTCTRLTATLEAACWNVCENGARDSWARFDAVLIDETQDFCCEWLTSARLALKEPDDGDLFLAGDGTQKTARSRRFTWSKAGIHARAGVQSISIYELPEHEKPAESGRTACREAPTPADIPKRTRIHSHVAEIDWKRARP